MLTASAARTRKVQKEYAAAPRPESCEFCAFTESHPQVVKGYGHFWVVHNKYPYAAWDSLEVLDHLMLVPKPHCVSVGELDAAAMAEFGKLLAEYEELGYSVYGRAPSNVSRSQMHQHTHLLKLGGRLKKFQLHIRKPYIFISR